MPMRECQVRANERYKAKKEVLQIYLDPGVKNKFKEKALRLNIPLWKLVTQAIDAYEVKQ
jgi:hypothetical protein